MANLRKLIKKALKLGDLDKLNVALDKGADVNYLEIDFFRADRWETPIQWALESDNPAILKRLLDYDKSILNHAVLASSKKTKNLITPIFWAVQKEKYDMVDILLRHHENIILDIGGNIRDKDGEVIEHIRSPLSLAIDKKDDRLIYALKQARLKQIHYNIGQLSTKIDLLKTEFNELAPPVKEPPSIKHSKKFKM